MAHSAGIHRADNRRVKLPPYDAILLTGGAATRMGGRPKPAMLVGDTSLAERVATAVAGAARLIVVGPAFGLDADVVTAEEPPGSGPVAAIAAGVGHVRTAYVAVLAADLPFLTAEVIDDLRTAVIGFDVALLTDDSGNDQFLCAVWPTGALRAALDRLGESAGASVRQLVAHGGRAVRRSVSTMDGPPPWFDCDTEADLRRARRWV